MTTLAPLRLLLELAERQRDEAIGVHRRAQAAHRAAIEQAQQLEQYRLDYEQRWQSQFRTQVAIELLQRYQDFKARLTLAVDQQHRAVDHAAVPVERAMVALQAIELRCASVRKLIDRRLLEERLAADRRDQKQTDEAAARAAWQRIGSTRPAPF